MAKNRNEKTKQTKRPTEKSAVSDAYVSNAVEFSKRKKDRKQKKERFLTVFVLSSLLLIICSIISYRVLFVVRSVKVEGSQRYTNEEILAYCDIPLDISIFSVDINKLEEKIYEDFTYIDTVDVSYALPDEIDIQLSDAVMTYFLIIDPKESQSEIIQYDIYSQSLKYLTTQAIKPDTLYGIKADIEDEEVISTVLEIIDIVQANEYSKIREVYIDSLSNIKIVYDRRVLIEIGTMADIEYKLELANHIAENELLETDIGVLDSKTYGEAVFKPAVDIYDLL